MPDRFLRCFRRFALAWASALCVANCGAIAAQTSTGGVQNPQISRIAGTIKSVSGQAITLTSDSGREVTARPGSTTRILRVAPGPKDLTKATAIGVQDLQPGDRVLVRGQASTDGASIAALAVIVMKQADVSAKREHDRQDWQVRGVGGLVDSIDTTGSTVMVLSGGFGPTKTIAIHIVKGTILRRYAPDSTKFDDAKPAPVDQIKPGDQLRARGTRSDDGTQLSADEIVSGSFRNIAGTISAIDTAANTITVKDAIGKNAVAVKLTPDSQMKKLPPEMAQRIAMRLKAGSGQGGMQQASEDASPRPSAAPIAGAQRQRGRGEAPGERSGGPPDFDRLIARLPNSTLADLQKGDAVMIVSTSGEGGDVTAITLLAGVEAILTAAPNRNASAMMLAPWTLGDGGAEAEGGP